MIAGMLLPSYTANPEILSDEYVSHFTNIFETFELVKTKFKFSHVPSGIVALAIAKRCGRTYVRSTGNAVVKELIIHMYLQKE